MLVFRRVVVSVRFVRKSGISSDTPAREVLRAVWSVIRSLHGAGSFLICWRVTLCERGKGTCASTKNSLLYHSPGYLTTSIF